MKTDQIALEMFWRAPDRTHQRIVGLRDEKVLPTNIRYHLDHLTVVQDEFPDRIRLGDGDEVADVTHPVAPGAEGVYDYRLADSLTVSLPGSGSVRVYELQVRPERMDFPGFVGSVFLDRTTGAIVRMRFTFTPTSYVDPYLDYIRISLDNLLWEGEHWLPWRQEAELRRELPQLDFAAGSIIRGRFEIGPYVFNEPVPDALLARGRVSSVPVERREAFPFEEDIHAQLEEEGLATPASIEEIRDQAREIARDRYLSGLGRLRLHAPAASEIYRYRLAEGHVVGAGTTYAVSDDLSLQAHGGWAFGRERPFGTVALARPTGSALEAFLNRPRDIGPFAAASGVMNTLGGLLADEDWTDPWFVSGMTLEARGSGGDGFPLVDRFVIAAAWERHRSASPELGDAGEYRPLRPVAEGERVSLRWRFEWGGGGAPADGWGAAVGTALSLPVGELSRARPVTATLAWGRSDTWRDLDVEARLDAGLVDDPEPQDLFLLGGRGTLPGHPFRSFVGDRFWLLRAEASREVAAPWVALRALAAAGQAELEGALPDGWTGLPDAGVKGSVGAGLGLLWSVVRLDLARGLGSGGDWELVLSVAPRFHDWL